MSSTITLAQTIGWSKSFLANLDFTVNPHNEPAVSSANTIRQTILGAPFEWRWNRANTGFYTVKGTQDYVLKSWIANTQYNLNDFIVDTNGNSQKVTTAGISGSSAPSWNSSTSGTTTDNAITWTNMGAIYNGSSSVSLGWVDTASVQDPTKGWMEIPVKNNLGLDANQSRPLNISAQLEDANGNYTFRLIPCPDAVYPINISVQQKAPLFVSTSQTWSPIPDELSFVYNWGFLALMYLYYEDNRFVLANTKFVASLLSLQDGLTETQRNIFLNNWASITGQPMYNMMKQQQGTQVRAL